MLSIGKMWDPDDAALGAAQSTSALSAVVSSGNVVAAMHVYVQDK